MQYLNSCIQKIDKTQIQELLSNKGEKIGTNEIIWKVNISKYYVTSITKKSYYDKAGNLPNKGRNFNTQTWGKIVYFLFVWLVGIGFRQIFFRVLPNFGDFGAKNVIFSLYNQPKPK